MKPGKHEHRTSGDPAIEVQIWSQPPLLLSQGLLAGVGKICGVNNLDWYKRVAFY